MCVSLLERVKQGKSNIILILILSARSQDRDTVQQLMLLGISRYFNPLGRKTETSLPVPLQHRKQYFNPLGRKTETRIETTFHTYARKFQSTRSQDRDMSSNSQNEI